jgi:hypothetical protein
MTELFDTIGPMGGSVADLTALHTTITGATVPELPLAGLRIGISVEPFWPDLDPQVHAVVSKRDARIPPRCGTLLPKAAADAP